MRTHVAGNEGTCERDCRPEGDANKNKNLPGIAVAEESKHRRAKHIGADEHSL